MSIPRKWVPAKWTSDRNCARLTREEIVTKRVLDLLLTGMVLVILSPSKHFFHVKQRTGHIRCLTAANTIAKYKGVMEGEVISAGLEYIARGDQISRRPVRPQSSCREHHNHHMISTGAKIE